MPKALHYLLVVDISARILAFSHLYVVLVLAALLLL